MIWLINNLGQVGSYFLIHTLLSLGAIVAAAVLSVPLARLAVATRRFGGLLLGAFSLLYAVPSLPMLVVIPVILGVPVRSPLNMVIVLTLYGISAPRLRRPSVPCPRMSSRPRTPWGSIRGGDSGRWRCRSPCRC